METNRSRKRPVSHFGHNRHPRGGEGLGKRRRVGAVLGGLAALTALSLGASAALAGHGTHSELKEMPNTPTLLNVAGNTNKTIDYAATQKRLAVEPIPAAVREAVRAVNQVQFVDLQHGGVSEGSGFPVEYRGKKYEITAGHVVAPPIPRETSVLHGTFPGDQVQSEELPARYEAGTNTDMALLKVKGLGQSGLQLATKEAAIGSEVYAIGDGSQPQKEIVDGYGTLPDGGQGIIMTPVEQGVQYGNSGGAIVNAGGQVEGVITAFDPNYSLADITQFGGPKYTHDQGAHNVPVNIGAATTPANLAAILNGPIHHAAQK